MIPAFLTWGLARKLAPYIAAALAIAAFLAWVDHRGYQRGFHKRDPEVALITRARDTALSNQRILQAGLDRQNAAVDALRVDGDKRAADGVKALREAQRANAGLVDKAEALRRSAGRKLTGEPCAVSDTLAKVTAL